ncbi:MAG: serine hydrolase [Pseudomonadota bacterium]|nr:serine hydrolase [Pseudomonadota bacterium]
MTETTTAAGAPRPSRRVGRIARRAAALAATALLAGCAPDQPGRVAAGFAAHALCSEAFVTGADPDALFESYVTPSLGALPAALTAWEADRERQTVTARFAGMFRARAVHAPGRGCTLVHGPVDPAPLPLGPMAPDGPGLLPGLPDAPVPPASPALAAALDRAFAETEGAPPRSRRAVVIVHDGTVVAERYAPGFGPDSRLASWSMAKSVTNALIGALSLAGRIEATAPAPVPAWRRPGDPHATVTTEQLLRQTSGQPFGAANNGFDPATRMLFLEGDMAAVAAAAPFDAAPGTRWAYTDGNYAILGGILRDLMGGTPEAVARASRALLFAPAGMTGAVQEFDEAGAPMAGTHVFAPARDWARLGQLFLSDGVVAGRRLLPAGWADWSARPTPQAGPGYGAGFWTNRGESEGARTRRGWGMPAGSYFASGHSGQTVVIAPEQRLVVVSMGFTPAPDALSTRRAAELTRDAIAALAPGG